MKKIYLNELEEKNSMEKTIFIYCSLGRHNYLVGRMWCHASKGKQSATFEYSDQWLDFENSFSLEPALPLGKGVFHTEPGMAMFRSIGDSAPDRWGRMLMQRRERKQANKLGRTPRTLLESDYVLQVNDTARQGALRFCNKKGGAFLSSDKTMPIPPLIRLTELLEASNRIQKNTELDSDLNLLFAPGASLGGARPKANVLGKKNELLIAKFPFHLDEYDMQLWETVALLLAEKSGIRVPPFHFQSTGIHSVLLLSRFDRENGVRIPFMSALCMIGANDNEQRSYLEIADVLRSDGSYPHEDLRELFRRIVFSILISNVDDHLRNHGFLRTSEGWRLSPAYDLNPTPTDIKERVLSTFINFDDPTASVDLALEVCEFFDLTKKQAKKIIGEVACVVRNWRRIAKKLGVGNSEIERMATAFEHEDLALAIKFI